MIRLLALLLRPLLYWGPVRRVRRNHGLEHATVHMLGRRVRNLSIAGRAVGNGFFLYGNVETSMVHEAVHEALERMQNGEHRLAVHPNCGTGLVTAGVMTSITTLLGTAGMSANWLQRLNRLPSLIMLSVAALVMSQPIGISLQHHITTEGEPGNLEVIEISRNEVKMPFSGNKMVIHRVWTRLG